MIMIVATCQETSAAFGRREHVRKPGARTRVHTVDFQSKHTVDY